MHVVLQIQPFRRKPKKLKSLFSRNKQRSKDIKHFTTASEIKAYQGHLPKHKPQEMITQYACNKPASWPLNIRLSAAKTRFTQSKFRMLHVLHCVVLVTFAREKKERAPLFKQTLKVTFHLITSLWVVFGLSTLISCCLGEWSMASLWWAVGEEFQRAGTEKMHREAVHSKWLPPLSLCVHFRKDFALKWPVSFDLLWV